MSDAEELACDVCGVAELDDGITELADGTLVCRGCISEGGAW